MKGFYRILCITMIGAVLAGCGSGSIASAPAGTASAGADAKDYPGKTIQFVIAANPGGGTDNTARIVQKYLPQVLGGNIVITYIEGGGGTVGNRTVKEAVPDGYTLSYFNEGIVNNQLAGIADFGMDIYDNILIPIIINTSFLVSNKFKTNEEMVKYGKANPGKLRFGIELGTGNAQVAAAWLMQNSIDGTLIDVGAVNGQVAALAGNHVDSIMVPINTVKDYISSGEFHLLAIPARDRNQDYPDTPTLMELGVNIYLSRYYYIGFPKGTPQAIAEKFEAAFKIINQNFDYLEDLRKINVTPVFMTLRASAQYVEETTEVMQKNNQYVVDYEKKYGKI
ncbi:MAG: tripartite tricarboxylate transporter substrate binding protein [Spirochaetales bacterium]|jgi:tripartite-type tricarboxylate transporter receptor subunit TctC|nr:tripartite tricarboxylate transporter substrate binding protein [Spirochaetales bacterium]